MPPGFHRLSYERPETRESHRVGVDGPRNADRRRRAQGSFAPMHRCSMGWDSPGVGKLIEISDRVQRSLKNTGAASHSRFFPRHGCRGPDTFRHPASFHPSFLLPVGYLSYLSLRFPAFHPAMYTGIVLSVLCCTCIGKIKIISKYVLYRTACK